MNWPERTASASPFSRTGQLRAVRFVAVRLSRAADTPAIALRLQGLRQGTPLLVATVSAVSNEAAYALVVQRPQVHDNGAENRNSPGGRGTAHAPERTSSCHRRSRIQSGRSSVWSKSSGTACGESGQWTWPAVRTPLPTSSASASKGWPRTGQVLVTWRPSTARATGARRLRGRVSSVERPRYQRTKQDG